MLRIVVRSTIALGILFALALMPALRPSVAEAHPLGNFSVNRYARIELGRDSLSLRYIIDMAEIPAFSEIKAIDANGDGTVSEAESTAYRTRKVPELLEGLALTVGGRSVHLAAPSSTLSFPEGQGGLSTLRLVIDNTAPTEASWLSGTSASFKDGNYTDRVVGWKEIVVTAGDGVALTTSSVAAVDQSAELTVYPESRLQSPLDVREASFGFAAAAPGAASEIRPTAPATSPSNAPVRTPDRFASLISREKLTPAFVAVSLLAAMFWGAAHALGPGHGKTLVAAYLVGSRANARHAVILGLTVTATHTSTVFALGLFTLYASRFLPAEDLYVWLSVASGALVLVMGAFLIASRLRSVLRARSKSSTHTNDDATHDHAGGFVHTHDAASWHDHAYDSPSAAPSVRPRSRRPIELDVVYASHAHPLGNTHDHEHEPAHDGHTHSHGGSTHSHLPAQPGLKGLLLLGISGGLLPCPTALVVMLASIALDRVAYGLVLVVAFSFGLAGVLTAVGVALVYAGRFVNRSGRAGNLLALPNVQRLMQAVPIVSAVVIFGVGLVLTGQALSTAL